MQPFTLSRPIQASLLVELDAPVDLKAGAPVPVMIDGKIMTIEVPQGGVKAGQHFCTHTIATDQMTEATSSSSSSSSCMSIDDHDDCTYSFFGAPSDFDVVPEEPRATTTDDDDDFVAYTYCT